MAEPVISLRGVTKAFGSHIVLRGVDLDLYRAENVAVLGRSGSGKSILIKMMVQLLRPDAGTIDVLGEPVPELTGRKLDELRLRMGFLFQSGALYDSMNVAENLAFPLRINQPHLSTGELRNRIEESLEAVGLLQSLSQYPSELSGGQRKRVGIARTLILRPEIMLYDEPTAGLDPITAAEINALIIEVRERHHTSAIIITHDLTCARTTSDRVAVLLDGVIAHDGTFDDVFSSDDPTVQQFRNYTDPGASGW